MTSAIGTAEPRCHDFFSHRQPLWKDAFWQLNCRFLFDKAPSLNIEPAIGRDWSQIFSRTWTLQQVPVALAFFWVGRSPWVVWGVFGHVFVSVARHSTVTFYHA